MNLWTSREIAEILLQLDKMKLPFDKYSLVTENGELKLLGRGGSAEVYEAESRTLHKPDYAIKVIGFGRRNADSEFFNEAIQAQVDIGNLLDNVVIIFDYTELWVSFDEKGNIVSAVKEKPEEMPRTSIQLQFVVMEKIPSVIERTKGGNLKMLPEQLAASDEQEVLKLAYDIGMALQETHNKNILHRDVKLENVFYSEKKKLYKLGDFGIAKITENGYASTIAFTKGYAAPEVRALEDQYDKTADIYSFGMMLYVLMNNLKFPDSNTYNVNSGAQYREGYIVPYPEGNISGDFYHIIAKACMYDPDQRYQSMEEMLLDIGKLMYSNKLGYKKEHKNASLVAGIILLVLGAVAWKLTLAPKMIISFSFWHYVFLAGCLGKGFQKIYKKDIKFLSLVVLGVGIYLIAVSGFSWWKLILLLWMTFSSGSSSGYVSSAVLTANFVSLIQQTTEYDLRSYEEYGWVAITLISLAAVLLYQYELLIMEDRKVMKIFYKKGVYWIVVCAIYGSLTIQAFVANPVTERLYRNMFGNGIMDAVDAINIAMIGIAGLGFCLLWIVRERILIWYQKKRMEGSV